MPRIPKKLHEHYQFEVFRKICDRAPNGIACVQECPDFLVHEHGAYTGIELTQYFKPTVPGRRPLQEQHALQAVIADRAQQIYEAAAGRRLRVNILFRPQTAIHKRQCPGIASALAAFIQSSTVTDLQQRFDAWDVGPAPRALTAVYAYKCPERVRSLWRIAAAGTVKPLGPEDVQSVIDVKEPSLAAYDERVARNWLVIVLDGSAASFASLTELALAHKYLSTFSEVHFLNVAAGTCAHLQVREPLRRRDGTKQTADRI